MQPTPEQRAEFAAVARRAEGPPNLSIAGDVAEIRVEGVLTPRPDWFARLVYGANTAYRDVIDALAIAAADSNVRSAVLAVDSPGGTVAGLFDTLTAIQSFGKPMRVRAANAQSAAYAIAAAAGPIEATGPAAMFGSVGTAIDFTFFSDVELVSITNTDSPDKRPDPRTPAGRKVIVAQLDALNALFVEAIAGGRKTSAANVTKNYGRGATLLAGEALKRGMIDSVASNKPAQTLRQSAGAAGAAKGSKVMMTADEIRAQFPGAAAQLVQEGVALERDRVTAHVIAGEQSGAIPTALTAIKDGTPMNQTMQTQYMTMAINRRDRQLRQMDSDSVAGAADGAARAGKTASKTGEEEEPVAGKWLMVEKGKVRVHSAA